MRFNAFQLVLITLAIVLCCTNIRDKKLYELKSNSGGIDSIKTLSQSEKDLVLRFIIRNSIEGNLDSNLTITQALKLQRKWAFDDSMKKAKDSLDKIERIKALVKLIPPKMQYAHPYKINTEYDKYKDYGSISMNGIRLNNALKLRVSVVYSGNSLTEIPETVHLMFISESETWEYLNSHDLTILLDDSDRIPIETSHDGSVGNGYVLEFITGDLSIDKFVQLVNSKKVELKLFTTEIRLDNQTINALKDFASNLAINRAHVASK